MGVVMFVLCLFSCHLVQKKRGLEWRCSSSQRQRPAAALIFVLLVDKGAAVNDATRGTWSMGEREGGVSQRRGKEGRTQ